jgi:hypothetical protein
MSRLSHLGFATVLGVSGWLLTTPAWGQLVTDNGTPIFEEGYENYLPGTQPTTPPVGSWIHIEPGGVANAGVYGPASGGPGAAVGNNYMHLVRPNTNANAYMYGGFSQPIATGDHLILDAHVWINDVSDFTFFTGFESADLSTHLWLEAVSVPGAAPDTYRVQVGGGGQGSDLIDITYTPQTWQDWKIDWIVGSTLATFTIDGQSQMRTVNAGTLATPISEVRFAAGNGPSTLYLDGPGVPEPGTFVLLSMGLACAGAWKFARKRKESNV